MVWYTKVSMNDSSLTNLAVVACPGGEVFADEVILRLQEGYCRNFEVMTSELAVRYNLDVHTVATRINFINDVLPVQFYIYASIP
jgi:ribose-phosphate pyrophosphokinase